MKLRRVLMALTAIIALLIGFGTRSVANAHFAPASDKEKEKHIAHQSFGEWEYDAYQLGDNVSLRINSDLRSKQAYKNLLTKIKGKQADAFRSIGRIPVTIVTNEPLKVEHFPALAKKHDLEVVSYTVITQDEQGELVTVFGAPDDEVLVPMSTLAAVVDATEARTGHTLQVKGIVAIEAIISSDAFPGLSTDPALFGIDLTPALALLDLKTKVKSIDTSTVRIVPSSLYWYVVTE